MNELSISSALKVLVRRAYAAFRLLMQTRSQRSVRRVRERIQWSGNLEQKKHGRPPAEDARVDSPQKFFRNAARAWATSRSQCATAE